MTSILSTRDQPARCRAEHDRRERCWGRTAGRAIPGQLIAAAAQHHRERRSRLGVSSGDAHAARRVARGLAGSRSVAKETRVY
jgi:hypothetical protein